MKKENYLKCWDCKKKNQKCYCDLDSKNLNKVNKIIDKELKNG